MKYLKISCQRIHHQKLWKSRQHKKENHICDSLRWLRGHDSNVRPPGYEPDELPTALPRGAKIQLFPYEASEFGFLFFLL